MTQKNKDIVVRFEQEYKNTANLDIFDELVAPDAYESTLPPAHVAPVASQQIS